MPGCAGADKAELTRGKVSAASGMAQGLGIGVEAFNLKFMLASTASGTTGSAAAAVDIESPGAARLTVPQRNTCRRTRRAGGGLRLRRTRRGPTQWQNLSFLNLRLSTGMTRRSPSRRPPPAARAARAASPGPQAATVTVPECNCQCSAACCQ